MLANVPRTYMRAFASAGNERVTYRWQLPDVGEGNVVSFRMIDADAGDDPNEIVDVSESEREEIRMLARIAREKATEKGGDGA